MTSPPEIKKSSAGRPSILSREDILNAALEIGLDELTMNNLAQHLSVGVSSIYYYFKNRKELIRAAAVYSFSNMDYPKDTGQNWIRLVLEYVASIRDNLIRNSSHIYGQQFSDLGFDVHFRLLEPFLEAMQKRGFAETDSMVLMNSIGMAAFGAAIETIRQDNFEQSGDTMKIAARRQFERHDVAEFPHLAKSLDIFTNTPQEKLENLLQPVLVGFAKNNERDTSDIDALLRQAL